MKTVGPDPALVNMVSEVDSSVTDGEKSQLLSLLEGFSDTFSYNENDLGWTEASSLTPSTQETASQSVNLYVVTHLHIWTLSRNTWRACWSRESSSRRRVLGRPMSCS